MGGPKMGRGLPYISLVLLHTLYEIRPAHPPKSSTHTILYAAELAIDPRPTRSEAVKAP